VARGRERGAVEEADIKNVGLVKAYSETKQDAYVLLTKEKEKNFCLYDG
jgi:hypothetical protein